MRARNPARRGYLDDTAWVPHRLDMMASPAWRSRPRPLAKMIERLEIEHMRHGGKENGNLVVTYDQFEAYGVSRRAICQMIEAGQALGIIEVIKPENWYGDVRPPNVYRLTYIPAKGKRAPTDEWNSITQEQAEIIVEKAKISTERQVTTMQGRRSVA